jgi:hypothetical protein
MDCPKCGLPGLADQKFCRSCGASLQMTTQPLAETATNLERKTTGTSRDGKQGLSRLVLLGFISMFIGVAIGVAIGVIGKTLLHQEIVTVVGVLLSVLGMFLTAYPYVWPSPRQKYDSSPPLSPEVLALSQPAKYLPQGNLDYLPSITERTTNLLKTPAVTKPKKEDGESQV